MVAAAVCLVAVGLLVGRLTAGESTAPRLVAASDDYVVVAGAIRPDADCEWHLIDDEAHDPVGIDSVTTAADGAVTIRYAAAGSSVVTFLAVPDETLARQGVKAGASADLDRAVLTVTPFDCAGVGDYANVWLYGLLER